MSLIQNNTTLFQSFDVKVLPKKFKEVKTPSELSFTVKKIVEAFKVAFHKARISGENSKRHSMLDYLENEGQALEIQKKNKKHLLVEKVIYYSALEMTKSYSKNLSLDQASTFFKKVQPFMVPWVQKHIHLVDLPTKNLTKVKIPSKFQKIATKVLGEFMPIFSQAGEKARLVEKMEKEEGIQFKVQFFPMLDLLKEEGCKLKIKKESKRHPDLDAAIFYCALKIARHPDVLSESFTRDLTTTLYSYVKPWVQKHIHEIK